MWTTDAQLAPPAPALGGARPVRLSLVGDERLARLVAHGDGRAFATLYERYHQRLYRYCRSMVRNDADAQDALQSAFAGAFAALERGQRDAPMRPWLYRIAYNESVSILRRRRADLVLAEVHETPTPSAADVAADRARLALLVADLGELTERQRGALVMRELSGLSHEEIGVAFGISTGSAKQTIFEARQSLAEFAQGRAMACDDICRAVSDGNGRTLRGRKIRAHMRDCASCAAFAEGISTRSRDLRAIAPPLSAVAATGLLRRALAGGSGHSGGGPAGIAAGTAGKAAGVAMVAKTVATVAVVATAAVGVTSEVKQLGSRSHTRAKATTPAPARHSSASAAGAGAGKQSVRGNTTGGSAARPDRSPGAAAAKTHADGVRAHGGVATVAPTAAAKGNSPASAVAVHGGSGQAHAPVARGREANPHANGNAGTRTHVNPAKPVHPTKPLHPVKPMQPVKATHRARPPQPAQPEHPAKPADVKATTGGATANTKPTRPSGAQSTGQGPTQTTTQPDSSAGDAPGSNGSLGAKGSSK